METPFLKIRDRIDTLRRNLEDMSDEFTRITHPDFDPINMPEIDGFSRVHSRSQDVYKILQVAAAEDEVNYQLTSVVYCLRMMEVSNVLIELQNQHKKSIPHAQWAAIDETIDKDGDKFVSLIDNAGALRLAREKIVPVSAMDEDSYRHQFQQLFAGYEQAQAGHVRWMFQYASKPDDILNYIFDARMAALDISLSYVESIDERIQGHMADYIMIRTARDEAIVEDSQVLLETQAYKQAFCRDKLPRTMAMVNMIDKFAEDLQGMGSDYLSRDNFEVDAYKPVSIKILPQFTP